MPAVDPGYGISHRVSSIKQQLRVKSVAQIQAGVECKIRRGKVPGLGRYNSGNSELRRRRQLPRLLVFILDIALRRGAQFVDEGRREGFRIGDVDASLIQHVETRE